MKAPNDSIVIIIGSMKSGTTSFYYYLIQHPEICPAVNKEPEFFTNNQEQELNINDYINLWDFDESIHKIALEASTGYTKYPYNKNIPKQIFESGLRPKLIYCVRNPFDRMLSQYRFVNNNPNWGNIELLSERNINISRYYMQLQQFRQFFKKEDIMIVDFDDIKNNANVATNKVFRFLNLSECRINDSIIFNKTYMPNERAIFIKNNFSAVLRIIPKVIRRKVRFLLQPFFNQKKPILTVDERQNIFNQLNEDMKSFQEEYNFDVSKWGF